MDTDPASLAVPPNPCWLDWIAVPSGDQAGIMAVLGLTEPAPVSFAEANDLVDSDGHGVTDADSMAYRRVFVTPELDGWTLVMGRWCGPADPARQADILRLCQELSRRYGRAQAYFFGLAGDGSAWLLVEDEIVLRRLAITGEPSDQTLTIGDPLPYEQARYAALATRAAPGDLEEDWRSELHEMAPDVAAAHGVSPFQIGRHTRVRGSGVMARTPAAS